MVHIISIHLEILSRSFYKQLTDKTSTIDSQWHGIFFSLLFYNRDTPAPTRGSACYYKWYILVVYCSPVDIYHVSMKYLCCELCMLYINNIGKKYLSSLQTNVCINTGVIEPNIITITMCYVMLCFSQKYLIIFSYNYHIPN